MTKHVSRRASTSAAAHAPDPGSIEAALEAMLEESGAETMMALSIVRDLIRLKAGA